MKRLQIFKDKKARIMAIAFAMLIALAMIASLQKPIKTIDMHTYRSFLKNDLFTKARIDTERVILYTDEDRYAIIKEGIDLQELLDKVPVEIDTSGLHPEERFVLVLLFSLLLLILLFGRRTRRTREEEGKDQQNLAFNLDAYQFHRKIAPAVSEVTFKDVAGIEGVKEELAEVVDFLKNPEKYQAFGIKMPRGVLLIGPPGVGKTLIAKAVAGEANVPFFYQSGASFVQIYVGMGAKRVSELFQNAKRYAPSIIFIDEIDAVGKARGAMRNDERESTLNQLLTEMDGFEESSNVIVIAATNKIEVLDEALLRPGRFDRRVFVSLPDIREREAILGVYLQDKPHHLELSEIARMTVGFSGASLATLVNEAALYALKRKAKEVTMEDFLAVRDKVLLGKRKILSYNEEEKRIQATYQAAKALTAYWYEIDFDKITMIGSALNDIDREIESRTQMLAKLKVALSGYVACKLLFEEPFSNAMEDLHRARLLAAEMVEKYAMGDTIVATASDSISMLEEAQKELKSFLERAKPALFAIRDRLLNQESISKEEVGEIIGAVL